MRQFNGMKPEKMATGGRELLPAGGYVARILDAKEVEYSWGNVLLLSFDIDEGEKKGFFKADYMAQTSEDKKWRGTYRLNEPKGDGSERDGWSVRTFNNLVYCLEESNSGYHFDWDETKLKGKQIGVLFRNKEWAMNGKSGWTTECCAVCSAEDIRSKAFKTPKDKPLPEEQKAPELPSFEDTDFGLPF